MDEYFVEEKSGWDRLLDFLVFVAVLVVTIFLVLEMLGYSGKTDIDPVSVNAIYFWVSIVVFIIFTVDLVRLRVESPDTKYFLKHYWLDILATIPFGMISALIGANYSVLNALKWARAGKLAAATKVQKAARISKISKEFKAAAHMKQESEKYQKKHRL